VLLCDGIITDSESTKKDVLKNLVVGDSRVHAIHLGVDPVRFYHVDDDSGRVRLREQYKLPDDFILYVGTLEPRKNIPRLIRAFKNGVTDRGLPHHLVVAGRKGWLYDEIFRVVKSLNLEHSVHFPGHIEPHNLSMLYSMAHALAYPSLYEGFGLPCLEAMSCATPVIASDRSSLPELAAGCASIVDPTSVDAIADALNKICTDAEYHRRLSELGLQRARRFSWLTTAKRTVEVYNRTLEEA
jgi:glycosyltransferase involved in cell wall biosynthesis